MTKGDVSFTFLDRIGEIEQNIRDERWQSALALALTLPDICGGIAFPEMVKKYRDGRTMMDRYGNPTRDIGAQYTAWVDQYAAEFLKKDAADENPYLSGDRCWQLRCEYLHQNKGFVNTEEDQEYHFHLGLNCGTSVCQFDQPAVSSKSEAEEIRLDIQQLCHRLCLAARKFYDDHHETKDFSLYNTPVIDFIQWTQESKTAKFSPLIVVLMEDKVTAMGVKMALEQDDVEAVYFDDFDAVKKKIKKKSVSCWVVGDTFADRIDPSWEIEKAAPVVTVSLPIDIKTLRRQVYGQMKGAKR